MNEGIEYLPTKPNSDKGYSPQPCHTCRHYNNMHGDIDCYFCNPEFGEDRWESADKKDEEDEWSPMD